MKSKLIITSENKIYLRTGLIDELRQIIKRMDAHKLRMSSIWMNKSDYDDLKKWKKEG